MPTPRTLTEVQVRWVWTVSQTVPKAEIARHLGVHYSTIDAILDQRTYKDWQGPVDNLSATVPTEAETEPDGN